MVLNHSGNKYIKHFSCWNQLLCLIFGQLSDRESLRDLATIIEAHHSKIYHLGFEKIFLEAIYQNQMRTVRIRLLKNLLI